MRLCALGGDARMLGALDAARKAGWDTDYICREAELGELPQEANGVLLPWPVSFRDGMLSDTQIPTEKILGMLPKCRIALHGSGVSAQELPAAEHVLNPGTDEKFLRVNAQLTAEGAIARAMQKQGCALLGSTCVITGFGRIAQELAIRLVAMCAFVVVCARSEAQMRLAHSMGAHPVPLAQVASACRRVDWIFNTVPAQVLGKAALEKIPEGAWVMELASPPYGLNIELARHMGVTVLLESGLPGRYAPMRAGAALFDALVRAMGEGGKQLG